MRCLYCGKELPLFKRLRGGEFCSDAHRQQYQEEYTQLALSRLLHANAAGEAEPAKGKSADAVPAKETKAAPASVNPLMGLESPALKRRERLAREETHAPAPTPAPDLTPAPAAAKTAAPPPEPAAPARATAKMEPHPRTAVLEPLPPAAPKKAAPPPEPEELPPAEVAGYLVAPPVAVMAETSGIPRGELALDTPTTPLLPRMLELHLSDQEAQLPRAGRVTARIAHAVELCPSLRERSLEVREFVRSLPVVEIHLAPLSGMEMTRPQDPLELKFEHQAPADSPRLWQCADHEFPQSPVLLGELARLDFENTGWSEKALAESEAGVCIEVETPPSADVATPPPAPSKSAAPGLTPPPAAQPVRFDPVRFEPVAPARVLPEPVHFEPVHIEPMFLEQSSAPAVVEKPAPEPKPAPPSAPKLPVPEAVTKPLPVTLHGIAPARGKSVQVFSSALVRDSEIVTPAQSALPMRPLMLLGPPPEAAAKGPEPAAPRTVPEKQELRKPNGKGRKSHVRVLSLQLREDPAKSGAKKDEPQPTPKPEPNPDKVPAAEPMQEPEPAKPRPTPPAAKKTPETAMETPASAAKSERKPAPMPDPAGLPKPAAAAASRTSPELESLGLPNLVVETDGNFWSRLPATARLGVAAGLLALIAGGIFLTSRGSSAPTAASQGFPEVGPPITDAGWATDWFSDGPASKGARHVDVLRGSLTLRDYRVEFEGQIERQAIGWVFRANAKNFYVEKIAIAGPGFAPPVELVRFAVLDGKEQPREKFRLPFKVHLDTMYKVRMDAIGDHFSTWIQDQKVDEWTDARIPVGGVGLYYDSGDVPKLKDSINVMPLRPR